MNRAGLRVTGGSLGGRRLRVPPQGARPTADRVREAVFARLGDVTGMDVLDLYAGSGVLGVEALSRGARSLVCVERSARCAAVLRDNLAALDLDRVSRVLRGDVPRVVRRLGRSGERFDLVFLDPPYASDEVGRALEALRSSGVLAEAALVVVEHGRHHPLPETPGWSQLDRRDYGDTSVTRLAASPDAEQGGPGGA